MIDLKITIADQNQYFDEDLYLDSLTEEIRKELRTLYAQGMGLRLVSQDKGAFYIEATKTIPIPKLTE